MTIEKTLEERETRYGKFTDHAEITQNIKSAMISSKNWETLSPDKKEALEMIAHKIGRILNGDPSYHDSWHDIIGYTKLVADTLIQPEFGCIIKKTESGETIPNDIYSHDWRLFQPSENSLCPVYPGTLLQIAFGTHTVMTTCPERYGWNTTVRPINQIYAYRHPKNIDDLAPDPYHLRPE